MKKLSLLFVVLFFLAGCGTSGMINVDGNVDEVEAALIRAAVGLSMSVAPETVPPAYAVSTAILSRIDGSSVLLSDLDTAVTAEVDSLDLVPVERQSLLDLVALVRARIIQQLKDKGVADADQRMIVVRQVIEIVRQSAAARMGITGGVEWPDIKSQLNWQTLDQLMDQAIEQAAAETDAKLNIDEYKARLLRQIAENRKSFEIEHAAEIAALKGSSI